MSNSEQRSEATEAERRARLIAVRTLEAPRESTEQRYLREALNACCKGSTKAGELLFEVALQRTISYFGEDEHIMRLEALLHFARLCVEQDGSEHRKAWRAEVDEVLAGSEWVWDEKEETP